MQAWEAAQAAVQVDEVDEVDWDLLGKIRKQCGVVVAKRRAKKDTGNSFGAVMARKFRRRKPEDIKGHLEALGVNVERVSEYVFVRRAAEMCFGGAGVVVGEGRCCCCSCWCCWCGGGCGGC